MNTRNNLILLKGEDKTKEIKSCKYNDLTCKYDVVFNNSTKVFSYAYNSVSWFNNPDIIPPSIVRIRYGEMILNHVSYIGVFEKYYWHIIYENGWENTYPVSQLDVNYSCLLTESNRKVFNYLKLIAEEISVKTEDDTKILVNQYEKMQQYLGENTAVAKYLHPCNLEKFNDNQLVIFPFGSNSSQTAAVNNALSNQISVIEGPPGTGKTQTILNIIANLVIRGKTVQVVSNNNSATENVYEKLCKYGYGFLVAPLGKKDNRELFISKQDGKIPDISKWKLEPDKLIEISAKITELSQLLNSVFESQKELAILKQILSSIKTEKVYFDKLYTQKYDVYAKSKIKSSKLMNLWIRLDNDKNELSLLSKFNLMYVFGIKIRKQFDLSIEKFILIVKDNYYNLKISEIEKRIHEIETELSKINAKDLLDEYVENSKIFFNNSIYEKYGSSTSRRIYESSDLSLHSEEFIKDYPIVLSTTYSSRSSLTNYTYDYIIMDEASQVDVATGALALSVAENAVIVGDRKQLPNVVTELDKKKTEEIFSHFNIDEGYDFSNYSFLSSVCKLIPDVPNTLLREHYRCHPKIIGFCNKKFYNDELVVMTKDNDESDVMKVYKTSKGSHARGHISKRQIDEICEHIIPELNNDDISQIGIIAPYRDQVKALWKVLDKDSILIDTVHKFQGREKDDIIMSTVDDEITSFSDDENLLNVAVSRAVKRFRIVVNPADENDNTNIGDLVKYIEYNNFEIIESDICSIFDYLYKEYWSEKQKIIENSKKVSDYDSENLMYNLIKNVLNENNYTDLDVVVHLSLKEIFKNLSRLTDDEKYFVSNTDSHVDFMIYSKVSKAPVLAVEVDGYNFHKAGTKQHERDIVKNTIFEKYNLPLIRFATNGSNEEQKLINAIEEIKF